MVLARHLYMRMMRRGRALSLLALASVPGLVYWLAAFDTSIDEKESLYSSIVSTVGFTYAIAALILTVATLREERDAGTLPYIYMRPIPRLWLAASALAAGVAAALVIGVGGWFVTLLAALAVGADVSVALSGLALFVAAAVGYSAVFVPLGYLVPRAILAGLGYIIVIESIVASAVTGLGQFSIWRIALSVYADLAPAFSFEAGEMLGAVGPGAWGGLAKILGVTAVGLAGLTWALRRRDAL